jgi:CheY-like chemotaxis protein
MHGTPASWALPVLVVDDNPDVADALALLLKLWGYRAVVAYGGHAALDAAATAPEPFAAAFLDLAMPDLNGYEVLGRLRALPQLQGTVFVCISGYGREEDRRRSLQAGFQHHFLKPVEPDELRQVLPAPAKTSAR